MKKNSKNFWLMNRIIPFVKDNKLLLLVALFFIIWKFFLIYTTWHNRPIAPEPDDSFIYIAHINSVIQCPSLLFCDGPYSLRTFGGWEHLSYRLFFGIIGKLLHLTAIQTYQLSFYLGTILLVPALIYFLKQLTKNYHLQVIGLSFLALYNGAGSYHGFFWVVPTFFSVLLFFLSFAIFLNNKSRYWYYTLPILSLLASLNHIVSIYASGIFLSYAIMEYLLIKKIDFLKIKKAILIIFSAIVIYVLPYLLINQNNPYSTNQLVNATEGLIVSRPLQFTVNQTSYSSASQTKIITHYLKNKLTIATNYFLKLIYIPGYQLFRTEYLNWLFPNIIGVFIFVFFLTILVIRRKYDILILYLSILSFSLISLKSVYGVRSLIYLWPITFILYAYGFYYSYQYIRKITITRYKFLRLIFFLGLLSFMVLNLIYSYLSALERNQTRRILIPQEFTTFLNSHKSYNLNCTTGIIGMLPNNKNNPRQINFCQGKNKAAKYFITIHEKIPPSKLQQFIAKFKHRAQPKMKLIIYDKQIPNGFKFYKKMGDVLIYKK